LLGHSTQAQPRPKLLVIDDLPHAGDAEQRRRLADALGDALAAARFPTVLTATETTGRGGANGRETSTPEGLHPVRQRVGCSDTSLFAHVPWSSLSTGLIMLERPSRPWMSRSYNSHIGGQAGVVAISNSGGLLWL